MYRQIKFMITDSSLDDAGTVLGGIAHYDENDNIEYVICACCGGTFSPDEIVILKKYTYWVDFSHTIIDE